MAVVVEENKKEIDVVVESLVMPSIWLQTAGKDVAIPYLQGDPGCGKTAVLYAIREKYNFNLYHCRFSMIPIEDISGIPQIKELSEEAARLSNISGKVYGTNWTMPELVSDIYEAASDGKPTIVFLDDFHLCSPSHSQYGFDLFSERKLRQYQLPSNIAFVLAGNTSTKSGAKQLLAAVGNRCAMYPVYMDFEYWKKNYAIPNRVNSKVLSFLSRSSNTRFCSETEVMNEPWGSFRAWTRFATLLSALESLPEYKRGVKQSVLLYMATGHIGAEGATAFATYYNLFSNIDTEAIFLKNAKIEVPNEADKTYIFCMACCSELYQGFYKSFIEKDTKFKIDKYYEKMAEIIIAISKSSRDMAIVTLRDIIDNSQSFGKSIAPAIRIRREIERLDKGEFKSLMDRLDEYFD